MGDRVDETKAEIRAVIFDLDVSSRLTSIHSTFTYTRPFQTCKGTLLDTESLADWAVIDSFALTDIVIPSDVLSALKEGGYLLPWDLKRQLLGLRGSEWIPITMNYAKQHWNVDTGFDWDEEWEMCDKRQRLIDRFWSNWETRQGELCLNVKACEGADELVRKLKRANVPMAIATSSRKEGVDRKRAKDAAMFESMQVIVPGDHEDVKAGKPAPDIYLAAAKQLGVQPQQCLAFEDAVTGAQSARSAGCHVVAVPDPRMEKVAFEGIADEIIESMNSFSGKKWSLPIE